MTRFLLHIPDHPSVEMVPATFDYAPRNVRFEVMEYYYRRGTKYYFRGKVGKLVIDSPVFDTDHTLKRGESYKVKMSFKDSADVPIKTTPE